MLMAGLDGIKNKIHPGDPMDKDLYDLPPEELAGVPTVCGSLREALEALEADHEFLLAGDVFTSDQIDAYMDLKWEEIYAFEHAPHPIEYKMYRSEEHTSELQSLMRISYAVFCLKKKKTQPSPTHYTTEH